MKEKKKRKKKKKGKKKRKKEAKLAGVIEYLPWFPSLDFSTIRLRHISLFLSSASSKLWSLFQVRFRHLIISPFVLIIPMKLNHKLFNSSGYVVLCLKITNCFFFLFQILPNIMISRRKWGNLGRASASLRWKNWREFVCLTEYEQRDWLVVDVSDILFFFDFNFFVTSAM